MEIISTLVLLVSIVISVIGLPYYPPPPLSKCTTPPYQGPGSHSLFAGCVTPLDKLVYNQRFTKPGKWFQARTSLIKYPLPGYWRNEIISGIWIFDNDRNGTGGYAHILAGGIGQRNVTIELNSKTFKGFDFTVSIYGH